MPSANHDMVPSRRLALEPLENRWLLSLGDLLHTFDNPTPAANDRFGAFVAASESLVVVSAPYDDTGASDAGSAYVFDAATGLVHTLNNPTPQTYDEFGISVAVFGNTVVVGARADDTGATDAGSAYVFDAASGDLLHTLNNPTPGGCDSFGQSVAVSGSIAVVGAPGDSPGASSDGSAYVFDVATGNLLRTINDPGHGSWDDFGSSVAVSESFIVVGAWQDSAAAHFSGSAYVFDAQSGNLLWTLSNPTPQDSDYFGWAVAVAGSTVVVGAFGDDTGATDSGSAYLFDANTGSLLATLNNPTPAPYAKFGGSVAVWGSFVLVGAGSSDWPASSPSSPSMFDANTGALLGTLNKPTPAGAERTGFASPVALSRGRAIVGAPFDDGAAIDVGAAFAFDTPEPGGIAGPTADIEDVTPDPRVSAVSEITILFSEEVAGFDLSDLTLTRSGGANLLAGSGATLITADNIHWILGGLSGLTAAQGEYVLTLLAPGSEIHGAEGNALAQDATERWSVNSPLAAHDAYSVDEDSTLNVLAEQGVLVNDSDAEGDALTAVLAAGPNNGALTLSPDGSFTYVPTADYHGIDTFAYRASDGVLASRSATVTIVIDNPPLALADSYDMDEDSTLSVDASLGLLANDSDANGDRLTATLVRGPLVGALTLSEDGSFTYTYAPLRDWPPDWPGTDEFVYAAYDGMEYSHSVAVSVTVYPVDDAPVAVDDAFDVHTGTVLVENVLWNDSEPDWQPITADLVTGTSHGTLEFNADGSFVYTPDNGFNGVDAFTYVANDGSLDSSPATATITVRSVFTVTTVDDDGPGTDSFAGLSIASAQNAVRGLYVVSFGRGIEIVGPPAFGNVLLGSGLYNNGKGLVIDSAPDNRIVGNDIGGNRQEGVRISGATASGNVLAGNSISHNSGSGVLISSSASHTVIGDACNEDNGNEISRNRGDGITLAADAGTGNAILVNYIYENASLGIDLGGDGVTVNDEGDEDTGANSLQNAPVLVARADEGDWGDVVYGSLDSTPNTDFRIQFYGPANRDPSGFGEGGDPFGAAIVRTNENGKASFTFVVDDLYGEDALTATATDPHGNTSEFSNWIEDIGGDDDGDSVPDNVEDGAPHGGDGDGDGWPDRWAAEVASFPNAVDGQYLTLTSCEFCGVGALANPSPIDAPAGTGFPVGFFQFKLLYSPETAAVSLLLPSGVTVASFYNYGPTPDNPADHWYDFAFDGLTGAEFADGVITLHFVDGQRGDNDLMRNGVISHLGGPGIITDDGDGVPAGIEQGAPNGGDGNNDGLPDSEQANVASLPNVVDPRYVTLVSPGGTTLAGVQALQNPSEADAPAGVEFPAGFFEFTVDGVPTSGASTITLLLPPDLTVTTYYKYGPTPDNPLNHWYEFAFDGNTGAEIGDGVITLHFVDGQRGDDDLTANGRVADAGGPGATVPPAHAALSGVVWVDFNDDGLVDFGEKGIAGINITLTGTDDLGNSVSESLLTDEDGAYNFLNLRPGTYAIQEEAIPPAYVDGKDALGTAGGQFDPVDEVFRLIGLAEDQIGLNYNFGERPAPGSAETRGQSAGIGFWQNKHGQALIKAFDGGPDSTNLSRWLAATLPNIFGASAAMNNLDGKTNAEVAAVYQQRFLVKGVKLDAQVLATALSVYATNRSLGGLWAGTYGFTVTEYGLGNCTYNVGSNGAAFGVADNTVMTVMDILLHAEDQAVNGALYNGNTILRKKANSVFDGINSLGDIG